MLPVRSRKRPPNGFSLIELVVALVVVAVLAGIAVQNYSKVRVHAEAAALSHDLHAIEDAIIRGVIDGHITMESDVPSLDALRRLLPDDQALLDPRLPEGMGLRLGKVAQDGVLWLMLQSDVTHRPIIDAVHEMRPMTSQEAGVTLVEAINVRTLQVASPGDMLSRSGTAGSSGNSGN